MSISWALRVVLAGVEVQRIAGGSPGATTMRTSWAVSVGPGVEAQPSPTMPLIMPAPAAPGTLWYRPAARPGTCSTAEAPAYLM